MCMFMKTIHIIGCQMRTNIVIDDALMNLALKTTGLKTKKEVVEEALKLLLKVKNNPS